MYSCISNTIIQILRKVFTTFQNSATAVSCNLIDENVR